MVLLTILISSIKKLKKTIDTIAAWLVNLKVRADKANNDINTFMKKGNNGVLVGSSVFGSFFLYISIDLYNHHGNLLMAATPTCLFIILIFGALIANSVKEKLRNQNRSPHIKLVGISMDFNERILRKIYNSLTRYEFLDEELTSFADFYNVLVLDFDEHDSALHFSCTQPQLKYILDKFKELKKGVHLTTFQRSEKIYHKGNLITSEVLSKKYNEFPPHQEFEQLIDSFFYFLGDK